ncbi:6-bladed beta-propeller [Fodinibius halophilus]|nr:6-bladed beta-propeller [Fodinibius halophilus]
MELLKYLFLLLLSAGLILGCSSEEKAPDESALHPLLLTKNLSIPITTEEALIGEFSGLATDNSGNIYAADTEQQKIHRFSDDGTYLNAIGREGKGPGEFTDLKPNIRIQADTLYVLQQRARRIELFNVTTAEFIRTIKLPDVEVNGAKIGSPRTIFPLANGQILAVFVDAYFRAPKEDEVPHQITISKLDATGAFVDKSLLQFPAPYPTARRLVYFEPGKVSIFITSIYSEFYVAANSKGQLYTGKSDSLHLKRYSRDGKRRGEVGAGSVGLPFTAADLDSVARDLPKNFKKAVQKVGTPSHWPAFKRLLVDDKGRGWVKRFDPGNPQQTWQGFDSKGNPRWEFILPKEVELYSINEESAYGIFNSDMSPRIISYEIDGL